MKNKPNNINIKQEFSDDEFDELFKWATEVYNEVDGVEEPSSEVDLSQYRVTISSGGQIKGIKGTKTKK